MLTPEQGKARIDALLRRSKAGKKARAVQKRAVVARTAPLEPLAFVVPGRPQPKQRARKGAGGRFYTPAATRAFEKQVAQVAWAERVRKYRTAWPMDAGYIVNLIVVLEAGQRADIDNVAKAVLDALNGVLWDDDAQVSALAIERGSNITGPCVAVTVEALP